MSLESIIPRDYKVEKLNNSPFQFLEGPVWDRKRQVLFFSDIEAKRTYMMDKNGEFAVLREGTAYGNGMALNSSGNLCICEMGMGAVTEFDPDTGTVVAVLADKFEGKPFNATNDLVFDKFGGMYFTDPFFVYGNRYQPSEAVYYRNPNGSIYLVATDAEKPNGIVLSAYGTKLLVDDTHNVNVWAYKVKSPGKLGEGEVFCRIKPPGHASNLPYVQKKGEADGMAIDVKGNLYVATYDGVQVFNPSGVLICTIQMPDGCENPANIAFGGSNMKTLFLTARKNLLSVETNNAGLELF